MSAPRAFAEHRPVRHGPGDWRCLCGVRLATSLYDPESESWYRSTGRKAARIAMGDHRNDLWMASSEGKAAVLEALALGCGWLLPDVARRRARLSCPCRFYACKSGAVVRVRWQLLRGDEVVEHDYCDDHAAALVEHPGLLEVGPLREACHA